jgi:hypothetical protein
MMRKSGMLGRARHDGVALVCLLLAACSSPEPTTIDGSTAEAFAETSAAARQDLPAADRLDFDRALTTLPARRHSAADPEALRRTTFDGMTGADVVEDYRRRR